MHRRHGMAKRRTTLLAAAALCVSQAIDYLTQAPQPAIIKASWGGALVPVFGWTWLLVGVLCLGHLRSGHLLRPMSVLTGLCIGWGAVWLLGGMDGLDVREAKSAVVYFALGVMVAALTALTPLEVKYEPTPDETEGQ